MYALSGCGIHLEVSFASRPIVQASVLQSITELSLEKLTCDRILKWATKRGFVAAF